MKIAIIGAGASGLVSTALLSKEHEVFLFERNDKPGRKILASGNGKANISNIHMEPSNYNHPAFVEEVFKQVPPTEVYDLFGKIGLFTYEDAEGRIYPYSLSSQSVLDCLLKHCQNADIQYSFNVNKIHFDGKWHIEGVSYAFDHLIVASGSIAGIIPKKQNGIYNYLSAYKMTRLKPALCGFRILNPLKDLSGLRVKAFATLLRNGKKIYQEYGEVIFKNDGISGIVIMNLEAIYTRDDSEAFYEISLNMLPNISDEALKKYSIDGIVHPKLVNYLKNYSKEDALAKLRNFRLSIIGNYDFPEAQVVDGGISLDSVCMDLTAKDNNTIHFGGEVLDINGKCGGYNLHFAFACGILNWKVISDACKNS